MKTSLRALLLMVMGLQVGHLKRFTLALIFVLPSFMSELFVFCSAALPNSENLQQSPFHLFAARVRIKFNDSHLRGAGPRFLC